MLPLLLLASLVALSSLSIYARDIDNDVRTTIGAILFDEKTNIAAFNPVTVGNIGKAVCLGTDDLPNHECFVYHELSKEELQGRFQIIVDESGIRRISFAPSAEELVVGVVEVTRAPAPNLLPVAMELQAVPKPQTKQVMRKRVIVDDAGVESVVEEEVLEVVEQDNRSWVQKNWMYIVPPLVLFLIFSPEPPKEQ